MHVKKKKEGKVTDKSVEEGYRNYGFMLKKLG